MAPEVVEEFKDDPAGIYFFRIGWGVDNVSASDPWDYSKSAFIAPMNMEILETNISVLEKARPGVDVPRDGKIATASPHKIHNY